jgi:uncharacterized protein
MDDRLGVPLDLICNDRESHRFMKGTLSRYPRCAALEGMVGTRVSCTIYKIRPATCRDFKRSWENSRGNALCDRARAIYGLLPFLPY